METTSVHLDTLALKTTDLERAQEAFSRLWQKYDFRVKTFQEGLGLTGIHLGVLGDKVVPDYSSLLGDQRERAESIQANHMDMCRFTGPDDPNYRRVAGELRSVYLAIQELQESNIRKTHLNEGLLRRTLAPHVTSLGRRDESRNGHRDNANASFERLKFPTMNSRYRAIPKPADGTCSWLFKHEKYQDWFHGRNLDLHRGLLLLQGKPGAGKSVLMKEVYRQVSLGQTISDYSTAAFFFHGQGQELEHSLLGMFRSLLYQMLPSQQSHFDRFKRVWNDESTPMLEEDPEEFFESIFSGPLSKRLFIFIDALDECDSTQFRRAAYFWREITEKAHYYNGARLNVLISTRHYPQIGLSHCPGIRVDEHNKRDVGRYIEQRARLVVIPEKVLSRLKCIIVRNSGGVFLWVVLAMDKMLEGWDQGQSFGALVEHMMRLPKELNTLFTDIVAPVNTETAHLTIRLFQWASLAVKPLRIHEWHHVLAFIRQPVFESLQDWRSSVHYTDDDERLESQIRNLSRGLLEVRALPTVNNDGSEMMSVRAGAGSLDFSHGETRVVEFIHESVREFFLEGEGFRTLDFDSRGNPKADGHLLIMETCLEYLDIVELDSLVEARDRWQQTSRRPLVNSQEDEDPIGGRTNQNRTKREYAAHALRYSHQSLGKFREEEQKSASPVPHRPSSARRRSVKRSPEDDLVLDLSRELPVSNTGIDIDRWIATSQFVSGQVVMNESARNSSAHPSTGAPSTQLLEDYPALLSYATHMFFTHARLAQSAGANPRPIIDRLLNEEGYLWTRWLALSEAAHPEIELHNFAASNGLDSWLQHMDGYFPTDELEDCREYCRQSKKTRRRLVDTTPRIMLPPLRSQWTHRGPLDDGIESFGSASSHSGSVTVAGSDDGKRDNGRGFSGEAW